MSVHVVLPCDVLEYVSLPPGDPFLSDWFYLPSESVADLQLHGPGQAELVRGLLASLANTLALSVVKSSRTARSRSWVDFPKQFLQPNLLARHDDRLMVVQHLFSHTLTQGVIGWEFRKSLCLSNGFLSKLLLFNKHKIRLTFYFPQILLFNSMLIACSTLSIV